MEIKGRTSRKEREGRALWDRGRVCAHSWPGFGVLYLNASGEETAREEAMPDVTAATTVGDRLARDHAVRPLPKTNVLHEG